MSHLFVWSPSAQPFRRLGFTLIELLTVLAIVGVLAAILVPVVGSARRAALEAQCVSNLRQVGLALVAYTQDHRGHFPFSTHGGGEAQSWINTLRPYLAQDDAVRVCPLDPRREALLAARLSSYALNEWLLPAPGAFGEVDWRFNRIDRITDPSRTFLAFVVREDAPVSISTDHTHSVGWSRWSNVLADIDPDRFRRGLGRAPDRTAGSSPYVFADGHVQVIGAAVLKQRIDAGTNFSRPGHW